MKYDSNKPLEEQIRGSKEVVVNYDPKDDSIDQFLYEVERLCKNGVTANLNIRFNHNNNLNGAKVKKELVNLSKNLDLNEFIKKVSLLQSSANKKLEEMSELCFKK